MTIDDFNKRFVNVGGTIEHDTADYIIYRFPGLPSMGIHCTRAHPPRRLLTMLKHALKGEVRPPRTAVEPVAQAEPEKRNGHHRYVEPPRPPRTQATISPAEPDMIRAVADQMKQRIEAERKQQVYEAEFARPVREEMPPPAPYIEREAPLKWSEHLEKLFEEHRDEFREALANLKRDSDEIERSEPNTKEIDVKTKRKAVSPEASAIGRALSAIKMQKTTPQQRRRSARTAAAAKWVAYQTAQAQKALQ